MEDVVDCEEDFVFYNNFVDSGLKSKKNPFGLKNSSLGFFLQEKAGM